MKKSKFIPNVNIKKLAKKASKTLAKVYKKVEKKPKKIKIKIKTKSQIKFFQKLREEKAKQNFREKILKLQATKANAIASGTKASATVNPDKISILNKEKKASPFGR
jgi:hypothetical protein